MGSILWLIPVLPLAGFLVNGLFRLPKPVAAFVACLGPIGSFVISVLAVTSIPSQGAWERSYFDWISVGPLNLPFGLRVDALAGVMILVVTGVGSLIHVYAVSYMWKDEGFSRFFAYLNLFMFSMLVLVMGSSIALMFVGWEGVGLCSYLLIGFWYKDLKNADAGVKAFVTNRIGDAGFILGIFVLYKMFGSLDFARMAEPRPIDASLAALAGALLFIGATGKSAQIPLYVWLPDAMAGPTPVSALIHAATMVTAGVYMMGRMHFLYAAVPGVLEVVVLVAAATAFLAAVIAVAQTDIKKVLAYSTISQLGFMFAGMATARFSTGLFHVVTHAFFKALLFLGAGAVIHALHGEQDIRKMGGLLKKLPLLAVVFIAGGLALAGTPLTSGYVSKDEILAAVLEQHAVGPYIFAWGLLVVTAGLTAFYTARLIMLVFYAPPEHEHHDLHKPDWLMMGPLVLLAILSIVGGLLGHPLEQFLGRLWGTPKVDPEAHHRSMYASWLVFILGFGSAFWLYGRGRETLRKLVEGPGRGLHRLAANKFYVDELYEYLVVAPVKMGAAAAWYVVDRILIDAVLVHGTARLTYWIGGAFRRLHTGSINVGIISFVVGALALMGYVGYKLALWTSRS